MQINVAITENTREIPKNFKLDLPTNQSHYF